MQLLNTIVNGSNDVNIPTVKLFIMPQNMPYAQADHLPRLQSLAAHHQTLSSSLEHATSVF